LIALDATVDLVGPGGQRVIRFADLHTGPEQPHVETVLRPGELITGFNIPAGPWTHRSRYLKVRDRESYEFGLATAAVALDLRGDVVNEARIGLGGVAYRPWRAREAEAALKGRRLDEASAVAVARIAFAGAKGHGENDYKIELGQRTLADALLQAGAMEV
jgi:xanthine dehydrogenase YagS FAD-binding subunit